MRICEWCGETIHTDEIPAGFGYIHEYCVDDALKAGAIYEEDLFDA